MGSVARKQEASAARDEFLSSGVVSPGAVGDTILTSWRRSRLAGVDVAAPDVPFDETASRTRLTHCATPVLDRLQEQLDGMPVTIALTGADSRILERRERDRSLARQLDRAYFAPGFSYAEDHVGTNGVGTPLEDGRAVFISGSEHFTERSVRFACAGAPICDPLTRRIEGLINISSMASDGHLLMRALAEEAGRDIEKRLLEDGSEHQRTVLEKFLSVCRRTPRHAVLSVSGDMVLANQLASNLLSPADEEMLRLTATENRTDTSDSPFDLSLSDGRQAHVRRHPMSDAPRTIAGTIFEIRLDDDRPVRRTGRYRSAVSSVPGLGGRSRAWLDTCGQAYDAARRNAPLLLGGEPGTGKFALARAVCRAAHPHGSRAVLDAASEGLADLLARLAVLAPSTIVVLRRPDTLDIESQDALAGALDDLARTRSPHWIVGTVRDSTALSAPLAARFTASATVPPLRHRVDDLPELVSLLLRREAPERAAECAPDALSVLGRNRWPGNLTELQGVLREALARRPAGPIRRDDLPATCFTTSRRSLTPLETLERDAILGALLSCSGNRKQAAEQLRMSRSSLYRKIHAYGITAV